MMVSQPETRVLLIIERQKEKRQRDNLLKSNKQKSRHPDKALSYRLELRMNHCQAVLLLMVFFNADIPDGDVCQLANSDY